MDSTMPLCPKCNAGMRKRIAKRGEHKGHCFWGCARFPYCRGIRDFIEALNDINPTQNFYQRLGVPDNANATWVKNAFDKLSALHHPDKGGKQCNFLLIHEAYEILSDEVQKKSYDEKLKIEQDKLNQITREENDKQNKLRWEKHERIGRIKKLVWKIWIFFWVTFWVTMIIIALFEGRFGFSSQPQRIYKHTSFSKNIPLSSENHSIKPTILSGNYKNSNTSSLDIKDGIDWKITAQYLVDSKKYMLFLNESPLISSVTLEIKPDILLAHHEILIFQNFESSQYTNTIVDITNGGSFKIEHVLGTLISFNVQMNCMELGLITSLNKSKVNFYKYCINENNKIKITNNNVSTFVKPQNLSSEGIIYQADNSGCLNKIGEFISDNCRLIFCHAFESKLYIEDSIYTNMLEDKCKINMVVD